MAVIDALVEVFTWVLLGAGAGCLLVALILRVADGQWHRVEAMIEHEDGDVVARWFDVSGVVGSVTLTQAQQAALDGRSAAELYAKQGRVDRLRLTRRTPALRQTLWLGAALIAAGAIVAVIGAILLFAGS